MTEQVIALQRLPFYDVLQSGEAICASCWRPLMRVGAAPVFLRPGVVAVGHARACPVLKFIQRFPGPSAGLPLRPGERDSFHRCYQNLARRVDADRVLRRRLELQRARRGTKPGTSAPQEKPSHG